MRPDGEERPYMRRDWLGYRWSAWMPLMAAHPLALGQLPLQPGLYRVRRVDRRGCLECVAWAADGVRDAVERLSRQVHLPVEPYDDPLGPAHRLWELRRSQRVSFEVSGTYVPGGDAAGRERAWEAYRVACRERVWQADRVAERGEESV